MEELNKIIANNICNLRVLNGMTQTDLADRLNYSDKLISKWERGDAAPNAYTLKKLSEIFGVSIDYLFEKHSDEKVMLPAENTKKESIRNRIITAISICGVWLIGLLVFIIFWIISAPIPSIFVYTLPVSIITLLVLNSIWNNGKHNYIIISGLIGAIALTVYIALLKFNCWQIFLVLIPAEFIVFLCAKLRK